MKLLLFIPLIVSCHPFVSEYELESDSINKCYAPYVIDQTQSPWTELDESVVKSSFHGCRKYYGAKSCPKVVVKTDHETYRVICHNGNK